MEGLRVVIVGLGSISQKHIAALRSIDAAVEIFALRSSKNSTDVDGVHSFYTINKIQNINPTFIMLCNPTILHEQMIEELIPFGKPLFIEKPSVHRIDKIYHLESLLKAKAIKTYVACNLRFLACLVFVKEQLDAKKPFINEVNVYAGSFLPDWRPTIDFRTNYSANSKLGGGVHLDLIHELDYLYWIFGKPTSVRRNLTNNSSLSIDAIDYANYNMNYKTFTANVVLNYYRKQYKRTFEIVFEEDIWLVDIAKNTVFSSKQNKTIYSSEKGILDTYRPQMQHFINYISYDTPAFNSFSESIEVLKIAIDNV